MNKEYYQANYKNGRAESSHKPDYKVAKNINRRIIIITGESAMRARTAKTLYTIFKDITKVVSAGFGFNHSLNFFRRFITISLKPSPSNSCI
jgi:hypothetical protein